MEDFPKEFKVISTREFFLEEKNIKTVPKNTLQRHIIAKYKKLKKEEGNE